MSTIEIERGYLQSWHERARTCAHACRVVAARVADGEAVHELELVAAALDSLALTVADVGALLPEVDP